MRPLSITMRAFGPFAIQESVDFTRFGENAFFLIHGQTGAGKTTILDAICFALYGKPSVSSRDERFFRSHLAAPDTTCEVEFLFQVGPKRYHIRRQPWQTVEKKGCSRELSHKVEFCEVCGDGILAGERLTKIGEVETRVTEILGFSADQFRQVVLLPQGEFRRLLLATSTDKEKILEKLFGTGRFRQIEEILKRRSAALHVELERLSSGMKGILENLGLADVDALRETITRVTGDKKERELLLAAALTRQEEAGKRLLVAQELWGRFEEQGQAHTALAACTARQGEVEAGRAKAALATRALNLHDLEEEITRTAAALVERQRELTALTGEIGEMERSRLPLEARVQELKKEQDGIDRLTAERALLEEKAKAVVRLTGLEQALSRSEAQLKQLRQQDEAHAQAIAQGETRLGALGVRIEKCAAEAGEKKGVEERIATLEGVLAQTVQLEKELKERGVLAARVVKGSAVVATRGEEQAMCQAGFDRLYEAFINGQAAVLATRHLSPGAPCPVCGSPDHPAPARAAGELPSEEQLKQARSSLEESGKALVTARDLLAELQGKLAVLEAGTAALENLLKERGGQSGEELSAELALLRERLEYLVRAGAELAACQQDRELLSESLRTNREERENLQGRLTGAAAEQSAGAALVARTREEIGEGYRKEHEISERLAVIDRQIQAIRSGLAAAEESLHTLISRTSVAGGKKGQMEAGITSLTTECAAARERFARRLQEEGFDSEAAYQSACLSRDEIAGLLKMVEECTAQLTAARERAARADEACREKERPDLEALSGHKDAVYLQVGALQKEIGGMQQELESLTQALEGLGERETRRMALEKQYSVTGALAAAVAGNNPKRMTLQRYVLAALFEEVALAASQRLMRMSRGRYHLNRSEGLIDGKRSGGLDLEVTDNYTGERRPAFTLSGGESFLASLALALGLSDVVLAQSGGRYLDAIFIDEGFGTLDPDTLDLAMNTLIDLHRSGRIIGIISHVGELRERITNRIEVVQGRDGSFIRMVS